MNRNFPPEQGATGLYAHKLTQYLESSSLFDLHIVSIGDGKSISHHSYVRSIYSGKVKWKRLFSTFYESWRLIRRALRAQADIYLILTDPPFLNFWASKMLRRYTWVLWTMDLYPDAFAANKLISKTNPIYRYYKKVLSSNPPAHYIALGENQAKYLAKEIYSKVSFHVSPVGLQALNKNESYTEDKMHKRDRIVFGYVGSIGEAHDELIIIDLMKMLDPDKHTFVLSCYGSKSEELTKEAENFSHVRIEPNHQKIDLAQIDIHIVSLSEKWTHICVPSKALSAIEAFGTILFFGNEKSDTWQYVKKAGWLISEKKDLSTFITRIDWQEISKKRIMAYNSYQNIARNKNLSFQKTQEIFIHLAHNKKSEK